MSERDGPKRLIALDDEIEDDGALSVGEGDEDEEIESPCPAGGDHEWQDVNAATSRTPLYTFCVKCRQRLEPS